MYHVINLSSLSTAIKALQMLLIINGVKFQEYFERFLENRSITPANTIISRFSLCVICCLQKEKDFFYTFVLFSSIFTKSLL